jgi:mannose-6-phosphate isomerase-like protein (cupin superfamily)
MTRSKGHRLTVQDLERRLPTPEGKRFVVGLERGELTVELYKPQGHDPQQPHTRDEAYIVVEGRGEFVMGDERVPFGPGDCLFVPAGMAHRFENFGESLTTWVVFYGPEGGDPTA